MDAAERGADYVAFGAFFPTATKQATARAAPDILRWWSELMVVPCVAIGGITVDNCRPLVEAGADFLCVIAGVRSEEHTSELQSLMRISYAVFCLKKKKQQYKHNKHIYQI